MNIQDKELLSELVLESRDHIAAIEPDLLALEQQGGSVSDELINRLFRAVHSVKGGFSFFGIESITRLAHVMENVMVRVRDKELSITPACVDALLLGVDKLRVMLDDIGHVDRMTIDAELAKLSPFLAGGAAAGPAPQAMSSVLGIGDEVHTCHPLVPDEKVLDILRHGKSIYQIMVFSQTDLVERKLTPLGLFEAWEKIGEIIDVALDTKGIKKLSGSSRQNVPYSILFSTVLEPDLIAAGTGVPESQIQTVDLSKAKEVLKAQKAAQHKAETETAAAAESGQKAPRHDTKIEDALRVKVGLLNNLMNLAGELVLSRNQLLQNVNRKISESLSTESAFKNVDRQVEKSCTTAVESLRRNPANAEQVVTAEFERIRAAYRTSLDFRLADLPGLRGIMQNIDSVTSMLQENIMQTRLQPISIVFSKFPRVIRDLAKKCNKEVNLTTIGQDVELDKSIVELLSDPLTHLIRNAVDHGIEAPEVRKARGKSPCGEVVLRAYHESGKVNIEIYDDGGGIDTVRVREKAVAMGLATAESIAHMPDTEVNMFIMAAGFSTAAKVSDISGRGVGMDVVKTNIEHLGGTIEILSEPGQGTRFIMKLPLTLAIISSLIVTAEESRFALPQVNIEELVRVRSKDITKKIERVGGAEVYRLRNRLLPLVRLASVLGIKPTFEQPAQGERAEDQRSRWSDRRGVPEEDGGDTAAAGTDSAADAERRRGADRRRSVRNAIKIVVLRAGENLFGLVVDDVYDSEEIVVKPLSGYLKNCLCYAGSTIMGDGSVAMILDTNGLSKYGQLNFATIEKENAQERERLEKVVVKKTEDMLLFSNGGSERFGLRLSEVARVEKVAVSKIEIVGKKEFLTYPDYSMRVLRLEDYLPVSRPVSTVEEMYVIVPKQSPQPLGVAAVRVDDVVKTELTVETRNIHGAGLSGSAIIAGNLTLLPDLKQVFAAVEAEA